MRSSGIQILLLALLSVLTALGCQRDPTSSRKPIVINQTDNFHFQFSNLKNLDTNLVYYWPMEGTSANIDQSASIQGGQVSVLLQDSSQVQVYQTDLKQNGSFVTSSGTSGVWRIQFTLTNYSGLIDFRAQRK